MSKSINQVTLMGNLTRDPDLRQTPGGQQVVSISLALNSSYQDKATQEWKEKTEFIDVVAWAKLAENVSTFTKKGSRVLVQGKLQTRQWEQDGQKRSKTEVLASDITFMDSANTSQNQSARPQPATNTGKTTDDEPINLDDIPF